MREKEHKRMGLGRKRRKSMIMTSTFREIRQSFGRWFAIFAIVALGVGFFVGLKITKSCMLETEYQYLKEQEMYDFRLLSTLGFTQEDVEEISKVKGIKKAVGSYETDLLCQMTEEKEGVLKVHALTEGINLPVLKSGRMPKNNQECLLDASCESEKLTIGSKIQVVDNNKEDALDMIQSRTLTVTGFANSPYYMNFERGTTSLGNGTIAGFIYVTEDFFDCEYFTQILLRKDTDEKCYSKEYKDSVKEIEERLEPLVTERVDLRFEDIKNDAQEEIKKAEDELSEEEAKAKRQLKVALTELENARKELDDAKEKIQEGQQKIDSGKKTLNSKEVELKEKERELQQALQSCPYEFMPQYQQIQAGLEQVEAGKAQIAQSRKSLASKEKELEESKKEIEEGEEAYEKGTQEYEDSKAEFEEKIQDAKEKLADAKQEIEDLEAPEYFILGRSANIGYSCFESDSDIVDGIANVFPIFFFLVASLVCMTTMNRMVEEQRTQIGILKALGFSEGKILSKYLFYSGSAAALGGIVGFFVGSSVFPSVIWSGYGIMYCMPSVILVYDYMYAIAAVMVALLCSMGTTFFTCKYELAENAAALIRPKPAKNGKRILLERVTFLWKSMKFLHKVSLRNLIRYKQRFVMMILGISGCTALLATGFGIKDSICFVVDKQYGQIQTNDITVNFEDEFTGEETFLKEGKDWIENALFSYQTTLDFVYQEHVKSVNLVAIDPKQEIASCLSLHDKKENKISYPKKNEAVITEKFADRYKVKVGDEITLRDEEMNQMQIKVSGICQNYVYNYVYVTKETYEVGMKKKAYVNTAYVNIYEDRDVHEAGAKISELDKVTMITVLSDVRQRFASMMSSLNYVVLLVVVSAGLLAFIVLYNLTNINITERIREIATIKVLGFYPSETASYVFRENMILTVIGALAGLVLGKYLHRFVMDNIDIDMVSFQVQILPQSYGYSFCLTMVFAIVVDIVMYMKLEKINMAESLKSVE